MEQLLLTYIIIDFISENEFFPKLSMFIPLFFETFTMRSPHTAK